MTRPRSIRASLWAVALLAATLSPVVGAVPEACAAPAPHAALVVDTGRQAERFCVRFPEGRTSVTGIELIQLASVQHGLSYRFAQYDVGLAVCMLAGVGPSTGECLGTPYWAYWHGDGSGGWVGSSVGAGKWTVHDRAVEGWAWGGTSTQPPPTTIESVCGPDRPAPEPTPEPRPDSTPSPPDNERSGETSPGGAVPGGADRDSPGGRTAGSSGGDGRDDAGGGSTARSAEVPASGAGTSAGDDSATLSGSRRSEVRGRQPRGAGGTPWGAGAASGAEGSDRRSVAARPLSGTEDAPGPPAAGVIGVMASLAVAVAGARLLRRRNGNA